MRLRAAEVPDTNLNLIPIMNLFTALIPFLLLSAAFVHLSMIRAAIPVPSTEDRRSPVDPGRVLLHVAVEPLAYRVWIEADAVAPRERESFSRTIRRIHGDTAARSMNLERLHRLAVAIKERFPRSDTVVVHPAPETAYDDIVAVLDAVRARRTTEAGGAIRGGLFPRVLLAPSSAPTP